jgi:hypothetical protein
MFSRWGAHHRRVFKGVALPFKLAIACFIAALAVIPTASAHSSITGPAMKANASIKGQIYTLKLSILAPRNHAEPGGYVRISTCGGTTPKTLRMVGLSISQARKVLYWRFKSVPPRSAGPYQATFHFVLPQEGGPHTCIRLFEHIRGYKSEGPIDLITGTA